MPLEDEVPVLDDRSYDDLITEVRARIPRYTPEWTDLNDNDPGMAVVQVFAWLTDMLMYRLGRVPEANYIKFLQLVGIELAQARPAKAWVTFPVRATAAKSSIDVPRRAQVSAEDPAGGAPRVFETEVSLVALRAKLAEVQVADGPSVQVRTIENADSTTSFEPLGASAGVDSALYLGFEDDAGPLPATELALAVMMSDAAAPKVVTCSGVARTARAPATLNWEYWDGTVWRSLTLLEDGSLAFSRSGFVRLQLPATGALAKTGMLEITEAHYWIRARVLSSSYEKVPRILGVRTNTVAVTQAQTVEDEVLGGSDGSPSQVVFVENKPVLDVPLELEVDEGSGFVRWREVPDFLGSGPFDQDYVLNRTTGEVRFGDGRHGAIPAGNPTRRGRSLVARRYRFGGGAAGNVGAGTIKTLVTSIVGIDPAGVTNELAAGGGSDEQTLDDAVLRAPSAIRSRGRAITRDDYVEQARAAGNVRRALALPLHHPSFPGVEVPGVVTVLIVPDGEGAAPMPSEATLRGVCAHLNRVRPIATELYVIPPVYRRIEVEAELLLDEDADRAAVTQAVQGALETYLHPLVGGEDGTGWPFGETVYFSRVHRQLLVEGVRAVERMVLSIDGEPRDECHDVQLCPGDLTSSGAHQIQLRFDYETRASQ